MEKLFQSKLFSIILSVVIIVAAAIYAINMITQMKPEVSIDGEVLRTGMTVEDLAASGFSVGISMTGSGGLDLEVQPDVPAQTRSSKTYYIFKDGEYTNVSFGIYNNGKESCEFKDSRVCYYSCRFRFAFSDTEVLVNGIDVGGMDKEDAITAFEELGVKFDKDDKEEFLNSDYGFIIGKSGEYSFELETDDDKKTIESIRVNRKV